MSRTSTVFAFTLIVLSLVAGPASTVTTAGFNSPHRAGKSDSSGASHFKLTADDDARGANFGRRVAISGNTAAITGNGSTYMFVRSGAGWTQQQKLPGGGLAAIDDDTLAVAQTGSVSVFVRSGGTWALQQILTVPGAFAHSLDVNADTIILGDTFDSENCPQGNCGAAYVFAREGGSWSQQQKLKSDTAAGTEGFSTNAVVPAIPADEFGSAVAVSGDTALVGASGDNFTTGTAYVFVRNGLTWTRQQKLNSSDRNFNHYFGGAVALDGDTAVVGAQGAGGTVPPGAAYVFVRNGATWTQKQRLSAGDAEPGDLFGLSVAISGDTIAVGNYPEDTGDPNVPPHKTGSAYFFKYLDQAWTQQQQLKADDGVPGDFFGSDVSISRGNVVVGAFRDDTGGSMDAGSAYVFESDVDTIPPVLTVPSAINVEAANPAGRTVSYSVSASDNRDPNPTVACAPTSGSVFPLGTTPVSCTATDASNNSTHDGFPVSVLEAAPTPTPIPTPTPNPCLVVPRAADGGLRKAVALGSGPAVRTEDFGTHQDLLYNYHPPDPNSPCPNEPGGLGVDSNVGLLKQSGTNWVRLWVDWAALQPYSPSQMAQLPEGYRNVVLERTARFLDNLDRQVRTAQKERIQVVLTLHQRYPLWANNSIVQLPLSPDANGNVPGCDNLCQKANDPMTVAVNKKRKKKGKRALDLRDSFGRAPTDLGENSPWAAWVGFLVERYGLTWDKVNPYRQPCSHDFNGEGCRDYLRYVDFLEIVNEPNKTHWPQRSPDSSKGRLVMPGLVAQMFRTSKAVLDKRNAELVNAQPTQLNAGDTTLKLLGPATLDLSDIKGDKRYLGTAYDQFNTSLFESLRAMKFRPGPHFAWSHHNYADMEEGRDRKPKKATSNGETRLLPPNYADTNSAAWTRALLVVGVVSYKWGGWPGGSNPEVLLTEGGVRLNFARKFVVIDPSGLDDVTLQALWVKDNFDLMKTGPLSAGVGMFTNYLIYSDPCTDSGLRDFPGSKKEFLERGKGCNNSYFTGAGGGLRPLFDTWRRLQ